MSALESCFATKTKDNCETISANSRPFLDLGYFFIFLPPCIAFLPSHGYRGNKFWQKIRVKKSGLGFPKANSVDKGFLPKNSGNV